MSGLKFRCYTGWRQLPPDCAALFEPGARRSLFLSRPWFELLDEVDDEAGDLCLAGVTEGERLLALLPLRDRGNGLLTSFTHRYSSLFSLLLAPDVPRADVLACLADGLRRNGLRQLSLEPVDPKDALLGDFRSLLTAGGQECHQGFRFYNWYHRVAGTSFAVYLANRPSRLRHTLERKRRKLDRERDWQVRLYTGADFDTGLNDYVSVYNASWKAREQYPELLAALVARAAEQDWLRLAVLSIDDQPAAAQLWFVVGRKASIFRLAYDQTWRDYSPGTLLTAWLMERVIDDDRVEEIDFLTGNEAYKQDWMDARRERWGLSCSLSKEKETSRPGGLCSRLFRRRNPA